MDMLSGLGLLGDYADKLISLFRFGLEQIETQSEKISSLKNISAKKRIQTKKLVMLTQN